MESISRRRSREEVGVSILVSDDSIADWILALMPVCGEVSSVTQDIGTCENLLSKLPVFAPINSFSTPSHKRTAASRATFFFKRWSSMPFMALSRSSLVSVLPPTTFRKRPLMALTPVPSSPLLAVDCEAAALSASADARMSCTSSPRSLSTNLPLVVEPQVEASTASTALERPVASASESLVGLG